ncbi:MAG: PaaI family thioesterase [Cellvibrionales bacterium]|nr:PaaI family thioesterase [Cellvibrionales bacterium]
MTVGIDLPWTKMINPELSDLKDGEISLKQTPDAIHLNHNGDMHAGVIFSMLEMAGMGVVVMLLGEKANESLVLIKNISIDFLKPATGETTFTARLTDEQKGRILEKISTKEKIIEVVEVLATNADGIEVAAAKLTCYISSK